MAYTRNCKGCSTPFVTNSFQKVFCKPSCNNNLPYESQYPGMATSTVGAIAELRVAIDLMAKGYDVFRALSSSCSCDLAVVQNGKLLRIEVRTIYRNKKTGKIYKSMNKRDVGRYDHYAFCLPNEIIYEPPLEENR